MVCARRHERRLPFSHLDGLAFDREHPASFEHDINLIILMRLLLVGLWSDEDVDADLEPRRAVDDFVASPALLQPASRQLDVERVHRASLTGSLPWRTPPAAFPQAGIGRLRMTRPGACSTL